MPHAYDEENARSVDDLRALVAGLDDAALVTDLGGGWTVGMAFAHLAFWDRRAAAVCALWQKGIGTNPSPADDPEDDRTNEALTALLRLVPPHAAAQLALQSAADANAALASLTPELAEHASAEDSPIVAHRYRHRREHIAQINEALSRGTPRP